MAQAGRHSITRRGVIAASALVPAASPILAGRARDPIYEVLAAHTEAYAKLSSLLDAQEAMARALDDADEAAKPALAERLAALCKAEYPLGCAERVLANRILVTVPDTLAGTAATLRYVRECFEADGFGLYEEDGYRALLFSVERSIVSATASCPAAPAPDTQSRRSG